MLYFECSVLQVVFFLWNIKILSKCFRTVTVKFAADGRWICLKQSSVPDVYSQKISYLQNIFAGHEQPTFYRN